MRSKHRIQLQYADVVGPFKILPKGEADPAGEDYVVRRKSPEVRDRICPEKYQVDDHKENQRLQDDVA